MIALHQRHFHISPKFLFILSWFIRHKMTKGNEINGGKYKMVQI